MRRKIVLKWSWRAIAIPLFLMLVADAQVPDEVGPAKTREDGLYRGQNAEAVQEAPPVRDPRLRLRRRVKSAIRPAVERMAKGMSAGSADFVPPPLRRSADTPADM